MLTMTNAYPMEFRRDVVQVARNREPGLTLEKIAADFGIRHGSGTRTSISMGVFGSIYRKNQV